MRPVFVSYAREDSKLALRLAADLKERNADVWIDQLDIQPGQQWDREVERALRECHELLVVLSPHSVESNNVMDEISFALDEGKVVIPVVAADCQVPFRLRRRQYIDIRTDYEGGVQALVVTIAQRGRPMLAPDLPAVPPVEPDPPPVRPEPAPAAEIPLPAAPLPKPPAVQAPWGKRSGMLLLWTARLITVGGALLSVFLLDKHSSGGRYFGVSILFLLLSLAQFASWKWTRAGLAFTAVIVLCMLAIGGDANFGFFEYLIVLICALPAVLLFIRARINKSR